MRMSVGQWIRGAGVLAAIVNPRIKAVERQPHGVAAHRSVLEEGGQSPMRPSNPSPPVGASVQEPMCILYEKSDALKHGGLTHAANERVALEVARDSSTVPTPPHIMQLQAARLGGPASAAEFAAMRRELDILHAWVNAVAKGETPRIVEEAPPEYRTTSRNSIS